MVTHTDTAERVVGIVIGGGTDKSQVLPLKPALKALQLKLLKGY